MATASWTDPYKQRIIQLVTSASGLVMSCGNDVDPRTTTAFDSQTLDGRTIPTSTGAIVRTVDGTKAWVRTGGGKWIPVHRETKQLGNAGTQYHIFDSPQLYGDDAPGPIAVRFRFTVDTSINAYAFSLKLRLNGDAQFRIGAQIHTVKMDKSERLQVFRGLSDAGTGDNALLLDKTVQINSAAVPVSGVLPVALDFVIENPRTPTAGGVKCRLITWRLAYVEDGVASPNPFTLAKGEGLIMDEPAPVVGTLNTIGFEVGQYAGDGSYGWANCMDGSAVVEVERMP